MKKWFKVLQVKSGYVSVETVIIAGLMIGLATLATTEYYTVSETVLGTSVERVHQVQEVTIYSG